MTWCKYREISTWENKHLALCIDSDKTQKFWQSCIICIVGFIFFYETYTFIITSRGETTYWDNFALFFSNDSKTYEFSCSWATRLCKAFYTECYRVMNWFCMIYWASMSREDESYSSSSWFNRGSSLTQGKRYFFRIQKTQSWDSWNWLKNIQRYREFICSDINRSFLSVSLMR